MNRVRKGDLVEVIAGDDRGARGEIQAIDLSHGRVTIHGVNLVKKHQGRRGVRANTQTGIIEFEAPIDLSNVMPVCPSCDKPTRIGFAVQGSGRKARVCRACGAVLD